MKLILLPLSVLMLVSLLSLMGLGSTTLGVHSLYGSGSYSSDGWYDENGHQVAYINGTAYDDDGYMWLDPDDDTADYLGTYFWINSTPAGDYPLFDTSAGANRNYNFIGVDLSSSLGLIALVIGVMALAAIVGVKIFGSGEGEVSTMTILKGTAFLTLWGIFSAISLTLITQIPMSLGAIFYFILTAMYCVGIVQSIGGGGTD